MALTITATANAADEADILDGARNVLAEMGILPGSEKHNACMRLALAANKLFKASGRRRRGSITPLEAVHRVDDDGEVLCPHETRSEFLSKLRKILL